MAYPKYGRKAIITLNEVQQSVLFSLLRANLRSNWSNATFVSLSRSVKTFLVVVSLVIVYVVTVVVVVIVVSIDEQSASEFCTSFFAFVRFFTTIFSFPLFLLLLFFFFFLLFFVRKRNVSRIDPPRSTNGYVIPPVSSHFTTRVSSFLRSAICVGPQSREVSGIVVPRVSQSVCLASQLLYIWHIKRTGYRIGIDIYIYIFIYISSLSVRANLHSSLLARVCEARWPRRATRTHRAPRPNENCARLREQPARRAMSNHVFEHVSHLKIDGLRRLRRSRPSDRDRCPGVGSESLV